jgi:hypothetical protein
MAIVALIFKPLRSKAASARDPSPEVRPLVVSAALFSIVIMCDTSRNDLERGARTMDSLRMLAALCATVVWAESCYADCSSLHAIAQRHANDMARRNSLDHAGFMTRRGPAGAVAENVAMGCDTEACARRMWMQSPPHRANMMLGGCQAVATAVSASGRRYWAMEIGVTDIAGTHTSGAALARAARRGSGHDVIVGRDFSIDGGNAP